MATQAQRLAALEAEVAELRRAVVFTAELGDAIEARGYARGRASVLGGAGHAARTPEAGRWLHAVPEPGRSARGGCLMSTVPGGAARFAARHRPGTAPAPDEGGAR